MNHSKSIEYIELTSGEFLNGGELRLARSVKVDSHRRQLDYDDASLVVKMLKRCGYYAGDDNPPINYCGVRIVVKPEDFSNASKVFMDVIDPPAHPSTSA